MSRPTPSLVDFDAIAGTGLGRRAAGWLGFKSLMDGRLGSNKPTLTLEEAFHVFAETVAEAADAKGIADALVRVAFEAADVRKVELVRERGWGASKLAEWPPSESAATARRPAVPSRDEDLLQGKSPMLGIPARHAGRTIATLWLYADQARRWPTDLVRTLTALATLAASSGFAPEDTAEPLTAPALDMATGLPNASFLEAFLNYAVAQAKRKHEPFSLICVGIDRGEAIRKLHGPNMVQEVGRLIARVIAATLRSSDLVARLDDTRLIAALPNARFDDALLIADTIRDAIQQAGQPSGAMPLLTSSLGVVAYPEHAPDAPTLLHAATEALIEARTQGPGRIFGPPLSGGAAYLKVAQCAS